MLIGLEKRFIFVANTKTASTSIESVLTPHAEIRFAKTSAQKHIALSEIEATAPWIFKKAGGGIDTFFTFGVMRDPVEWIFSWFRYRKQAEVQAPIPKAMTFEEFWQRRDWNIIRPNGLKHLQLQKFTSPEGRVLADVILPHGNLASGFSRICEGLGIKAPELPADNVSRQRKLPDVPATLLDEVRAFYAEDYALFDRIDAINAVGFRKLDEMDNVA